MTGQLVGRPTTAVIDAAALRHNFACLREAVAPRAALLAVVKADAYGHGAALIAPVLAAAGADWFGVATIEEAIELRQAKIAQPILVLTGAQAGDVAAAHEYGLAVAVVDRDMAHALRQKTGAQRLRVHIKVDTGMGRIGVLPADVPELVRDMRAAGCFEIEGVFSHFAYAGNLQQEFAEYQLKAFSRVLDRLSAAGERPRWVHLANSAATLTRADTHFTMVRPGIALYGVAPAGVGTADRLQPVMRLVTRVLQIKSVPAEFPVSYGQTFITRRPSRLAVIPIGYADGYARALSNRAAVLVRGQRAPVVGAVCMDLTIIDVTDIPEVGPGDEVVLWGRQGAAQIAVSEVAAWQDTIAYEVVNRVGKRVPRVLS